MSDAPRNHDRILAAIQAELWAITPESLQQIIAIAQGHGDLEAVAAKLGNKLPGTRRVQNRDGVAVLPVTGPIFRYANLYSEISGASSIETLATDFSAALADPAIKGIVLEIDSPGGMTAGISEFAAMVRAGSDIKPVVAYVSNFGASAAYWIASAAPRVIAADTAILGSIGTVMRASISKEKDTVEIVSAQSPNKRADLSTDAGKAQVQALVDAQAQVFIEAVANYRRTTAEKVLSDFGQGGVLVGQAAVAAGMADGLGSLEAVIAQMAAKPAAASSLKPTGAAMTLDELKAENAALYEQIKAEGHAAGLAAGLAEGAATERARIEAVYKIPLGAAHKDLIAGLMFDGKSTGADAALAVLAAEQGARDKMRDTMRAEAPAPLPHATVPEPSAANDQSQSASGTPEERAKANWDKDANLRAEFGNTFSRYLAYFNAAEAGQVRVLGAKR